MNPLKLNIKNFFSHEDSELEFDFKSCLLIGNTEGDYTKSNGSGKSAIFESMLWALFNKSRAPKMDDLIRWGELSAEVSMEFESSGEIFRVTRTRSKKNSSSTVTLEKIIDDEWKDVSGSTSSLTNKMIEDAIKLDYKTFLNTTYFRQNDASEFAEAEPFKRKEILKSIVDINKWDVWEDAAKLKVKNLKTDIKILDSQIDEINDIESKVSSEMEKLSDLSKKLDLINLNIETEEKSYELFLEEFLKIKSSISASSIAESEKEIESAKKTLSSFEAKLSISEDRLKKVVSSIDKSDRSIEESRAKIFSLERRDVSQTYLSELRGEISDLKASKTFIEKIISSESSKSIDFGECSSCGTLICEDNIAFLKKRSEEKVAKLSEDKEKIISKMKLMMSELKDLEENARINKVIEDEMSKISFLKDKRESLFSEKESILIDKEEYSERIRSTNMEIQVLEEKLASFKDSTYLESEQNLAKKKKILDNLRSNSLDLKKLVGVSEANVERYSERLNKLAETKEKLSKKQKELEDYQYLKNVFGKNGIQTILLENVIKNHQHIANEVLKDICNEPIQIHLDTQKDSSDGSKTLETLDLKIRKDGNVLDYDLLSGGEKFRISLSLALGLRELAARFGGTNLNLIMLDEVNSPLDRYGVETLFVSVIEKISNRYKTMVITHDETLKERFNHVIDVTKVNGISSINLNSSN